MSVVLVGITSILAVVVVVSWLARPVEFRNAVNRRWQAWIGRT